MSNDALTNTGHAKVAQKRKVAASPRDRYRLLVESVQDYAIFLVDKDGYVSTWNKGAEKIKGYKPREILGKHFSNFYLPRDVRAGKPERELELAVRFGRVEDEDWRVRKDGTRFWANVVITALYDKHDELVGFAKVTRDLTERKQHEDDLRNANTLLRRQQEELRRLNRSKDEFISLASHQLRTPATGVKQFLGMLLEGFLGELNPTQLEYIRKAYESNEHQISIVNNLLQVAQIDAGKVVLRKSAVNLQKLLHEVSEGHGELFKQREQEVRLHLPETPLRVPVDADYFRMVIENLVDNASKYTPARGRITLAARAAGSTAQISVTDTGVGIAPQDLTRLFEKFSRIPNLLSEAVGGTGLGLYWANKIIKLHGGRIEVESEADKGAAFHVYVPMGQVNA